MDGEARTGRGWPGAVVSAVVATALVAVLPSVPPAEGKGPAAGAPVAAARAPEHPALLPNMTPLPAKDLYITRSSGRRWLRLESGLANIGRGPMEVRSKGTRRCPDGQRHASQVIYHDVDGSNFFKRPVDTEITRRSAGCMVFHPQHDHWHFEAAARYTLRRPDGRNIIVAGKKMSFCLRDSERVPERYGSFHHPLFYGDCGRDTPQGISTGWVDVYQSFLAGQSLRLPKPVGNGRYCLQIRVDPRDELRESDETDNTSLRAFRLRGGSVTVIDPRPCRGR